MMADIGTIMLKEFMELFPRRARLRGAAQALMNIVLFGLFLPWQFGLTWLNSLSTLFWMMFGALFWTTSVVVDSFAGERERHTLEALLASRLSNRAILFGKFLAAVSYVWGQLMLSLLLGALVVSLAHGAGRLLFYRPGVALGAMGLGLLGAGLVASLGILVSLRAPTVRQAQQALLIPLSLMLTAPNLVLLMLPSDLQARIFAWLTDAEVVPLILAGLAGLLALDAGLLAAALVRFQRARLILD